MPARKQPTQEQQEQMTLLHILWLPDGRLCINGQSRKGHDPLLLSQNDDYLMAQRPRRNGSTSYKPPAILLYKKESRWEESHEGPRIIATLCIEVSVGQGYASNAIKPKKEAA